MPSILAVAVAALSVAPLALGHTWIEQLRSLNDKGKYVGEYGYPRGMVSKTDPGFDGDSMNWELPAKQGRVFIDEETPLCHPSQRAAKQSQDKYPRLQAAPGKFLAMRYMENGHITKPNNQLGKPEKGGTVFVYGTTEPKEDEKLATVLRWTQDGQGGDKRGVLLTTNDYDDGRCYEKNETPVSLERQLSDPNFAMGQVSDGPGNYPLFCETNVALPTDASTGKPYTLYWVWQWNTAPGIDPGLPKGKDEYYTTCLDVDVVDTFSQKAELEFALGPQQDAMSMAVSDFASRTALMTDAFQGEVGPIFQDKPTDAPSGMPAPPQSTLATSIVPPLLNGTSTHGAPSITKRPGTKPSPDAPGNGNVVTVTDTVYITVTAPAAVASTPNPEYIARNRNGAKFRGAFKERT